MELKNVIIIHSYNGDTRDSIAPHVEAFCRENRIDYYFPEFPTRTRADYPSWEAIMDRGMSRYKPGEDSIVIAHSLGTQFAVKYLACRNIRIRAYISVAGFVNFMGREDLKAIVERFTPTDKEFEKCRSLITERYSIYSDNDKMNPIENLEAYADRLSAEKILIPGGNHFDPQSPILHLTQIEDIIRK